MFAALVFYVLTGVCGPTPGYGFFSWAFQMPSIILKVSVDLCQQTCDSTIAPGSGQFLTSLGTVSLIKSASTVSLLTLASRITGMLRDVLMNSAFGVGAWTDVRSGWRFASLICSVGCLSAKD